MTARVRAIRHDFDWSSLRYPGERVIQSEIRLDGVLSERLMKDREKNGPESLEGRVAAGGVRVGPFLGSGLARLLDILRQTLQLSCRLELEIVPSMGTGVWVTSSSDGREKRIQVHARLLEGASARQFLFDVGRRVGQSLLDPVCLFSDPSIGMPEGTRSALLARGLWRFQEMTADRFGLLCCQDVETAIKRLIQQCSGVAGELLDLRLAEWLEGRPSEEEAMLSPREDDFLRLRCAALLKFAESQRYDGAFSATFFELGDSSNVGTRSVAEVGEPIPPALPLRSEPAAFASAGSPSPPSVTYRMVGGDPSIVEAVFADAVHAHEAPLMGAGPSLSIPSDAERAFEAEVRRNVGAHAAFWLLSQTQEVSSRQRALLADLFGEDVFDEVRPKFEQHGEQLFPEYCRSRRVDVLKLEHGVRLDMIKELVRLAMTDHHQPADYQSIFVELAALWDLSSEDLSQAWAEFVDPEFAQYGFRPAETVEVRLDGQWVTGTVESVDRASGEVRVRFSSTGKALRLHPLADVIRPKSVRQAS
jgi:hypothetical protein